MKDDTNIGSQGRIDLPPVVWKPGRPRAIPKEFEGVVLELYRQGYGYRATARILRTDYHLNPDFSTVKRLLKRLNVVPHKGSISKLLPKDPK